MKKTLLLLPLMSSLLAACNGLGTPDPTTQAFTGKGTAENAKVTSDYALSVSANGKTLKGVGTLKTGGTVSVQVSAEAVKTLPTFNLAGWRGNIGKTCDVGKLSVQQDATYIALDSLDFTDEGKKYELVAQTSVKNADGTVSVDRRLFFYTTQSGSLKGEVSCATSGRAYTLDVMLKPGWNVVHQKWTYNSTTQKYSGESMGNVERTKTYDGRWFALEVTQ